jgi:hypothetical protein
VVTGEVLVAQWLTRAKTSKVSGSRSFGDVRAEDFPSIA